MGNIYQNFKCDGDGTLLEVLAMQSTTGTVECPFCMSIIPIPRKEVDPAALSFIRMGEHSRDVGKFEDAFAAYQKAAELDPKEPEAFFGLALSKHKVQYLKDEVATPPRMQPICYEISGKKFSEDKNYRRALELATPEQRQEYERRAQEIDDIRAEFLRLKDSGLDYDCFICVKVGDGNDGTTQDSHEALRLYHHLKDRGFTPFYSEEEIKNRSGSNYEALILYALYTSECMLILCSNEDYLQTPWVKNEYMRFSKMIANDEKEENAITIVFRGAPIERLPGREGKIQGIDLQKPNAYSLIEDYVGSFTPVSANGAPEIQRKEYGQKRYEKKNVARTGVTKRQLNAMGGQEITVSDKAKLKIAADFLVRKDFENAIRFCDGMLKDNSSNGEAYWIRFLAEMRCTSDQAFRVYDAKKNAVVNYESLEKAIASTQDDARREHFYSLLYDRVATKEDLSAYCEYIVLPDSSDEDIDKLTEIMFRKALRERDGRVFDEVIKTITDTELYVSMNLEFAHTQTDADALTYYHNILSADEGHGEALWKVFAAELDFSDDHLISYCCQSESAKVMEDRLFAYGYNSFANGELFRLCLKYAENYPEAACSLFDFILTMIPKDQDKRFVKYVDRFITVLFRHNRTQYIGKYNELLLSLNSLNDNAYFNRVMLKHNYFNALQLIEIADRLMDDPDYFTALNSFTERYPEKSNLYMDIKEALSGLKSIVRTPECFEYLIENLYVTKEELTSCKEDVLQTLAHEANRCYSALLQENGCRDDDDLFQLRRDVTKDYNLTRAMTFAVEARKGGLVNKLDRIVSGQSAACIRNLASDRAAARRRRAAANSRGFYVFVVVFTVLCAALVIGSLIAAMVHFDPVFTFYLVLFRGNREAIFGVGIVLIILPFLIGVIWACIYAAADERGASAAFLAIILAITTLIAGLGGYKWKSSHSANTDIYIGENYVLGLKETDDGWKIMHFGGNALEVRLPDEYEGKKIVSIEKKAFSRTKITSITLPSHLKRIEKRAFFYCNDLLTIRIPASVESIGKMAFVMKNNYKDAKIILEDPYGWKRSSTSISYTNLIDPVQAAWYFRNPNNTTINRAWTHS